MLSVELSHLADVLDSAKQAKNVSQLARQYSSSIHDAIWNTTLVNDIFAYETNGSKLTCLHLSPRGSLLGIGFGGRYVMDDANVPVSSVLLSECPPLKTVSRSPYFHSLTSDSWIKAIQHMWQLANCYYPAKIRTMLRGRALKGLGMFKFDNPVFDHQSCVLLQWASHRRLESMVRS